ncbi:hypothetical protein BS17DRAFT_781518 [Gyrodon lividus]|nr:hypothetical protein BS17DRAFT_781518 [Gyrodon lividus]
MAHTMRWCCGREWATRTRELARGHLIVRDSTSRVCISPHHQVRTQRLKPLLVFAPPSAALFLGALSAHTKCYRLCTMSLILFKVIYLWL